MKMIQTLSEYIGDEINDVQKYSKCALMYKDTHPWLADSLYRIATEEAKHMEILHDDVVRVINEYRSKNGEPPQGMMTLYEYLHERHIDDFNTAKRYMDEYHK